MSKLKAAYVHWVRPNGEPGDGLEERVFAAVARMVDDLPSDVSADGHDAGTFLGTGEREVSFWFSTPDVGALDAVAAVVVGASDGVGTVEVREAAKPSLRQRVAGVYWRARYRVFPPKPVVLPAELRRLLNGELD